MGPESASRGDVGFHAVTEVGVEADSEIEWGWRGVDDPVPAVRPGGRVTFGLLVPDSLFSK